LSIINRPIHIKFVFIALDSFLRPRSVEERTIKKNLYSNQKLVFDNTTGDVKSTWLPLFAQGARELGFDVGVHRCF
jgi:hypothetical protein